MIKNQKGFTLIEIIAVLIILGILAAVALPRYFGMQKEAADKVADGAVASAYSALSMGYAAHLLNSPGAPATPSAACTAITLEGATITSITCSGGTWASGTTSNIVVSYTGGNSASKSRSWVAP